MTLCLRPMSFDKACEFIDRLHRHHKRPQGHKFSIGATRFGDLVGVAVVGRPVARKLDDGYTAEVTRLCVDPSLPPVVDRRGEAHKAGACSMLYGAAARAAKEMGYRRIFTYTLDDEEGASLRAAGWVQDGVSPGKSWSVASRPRDDKHPLGPKKRWRRDLNAAGYLLS